MGSYYGPFEAPSSEMHHAGGDFEMDHWASEPPLKDLDAEVGGRTVRAGRVSMFGDLVPISEAPPSDFWGEGMDSGFGELDTFLVKEQTTEPEAHLGFVNASQGFSSQGFESAVRNFNNSASQHFDSPVSHFEGSAHSGSMMTAGAHMVTLGAPVSQFEGSVHSTAGAHMVTVGSHFEGSAHSGMTAGANMPTAGSHLEGSVHSTAGAHMVTAGAQIFSTTGAGFCTSSYAGSDSSLHGSESFRRNSIAAGSSVGGSVHNGGEYYTPGDGSYRGGGLQAILIAGGSSQILPNGQRVCAWNGCQIAARGRTAFCIIHGGGKTCARGDCENAAEGRTKFCKEHGGGKKCQADGCQKSAEGKAQMCIAHGGGRRCKAEGCTHSARGSSGLCIRHGGGKRCQRENCQRSAEGHTQLCISHGGGRRCQYLGCTKGAQGSTNFCKAHGGGRRCVMPTCTKGAEGRTPFCKAHGGGNRCSFQGGQACTRSVHGGTKFCVAHGGGKRCKFIGCTKSARGRTDFCVRHGGGKRCVAPGCDKSAQGKTDLCKAHGGGKRCQYKADDFLSPCERFARGKTGLCAAHMALMKKKEKERMEQLGLAEQAPSAMHLGAPSNNAGQANGLWMRQGGEGPGANQLFYHVFSSNDQFGMKQNEENIDQKVSFALSLPTETFGEGRVRGGGGAEQLLSAGQIVPPNSAEMDVQKLDEVNAFRQAEASRIVSLFNQNASPEVRHMVGIANETLSSGGGVFGWADAPRRETVAESGPESLGLSSNSDALFAEGYPGSGDERVRGASSVLNWLQTGLPMERLGNSYGFSDSGSSQGNGGSTHAGSLFSNMFGAAQKPAEENKRVDTFLAGIGEERANGKKSVMGPSLSTGAMRSPSQRGFGIQSFSDGGLLGRKTFKPDLRGWEFGAQNESAQNNESGLTTENQPGLKGTPEALGSLRKMQERQWQDAHHNSDVSMQQMMTSPLLLADEPALGARVQGFARGYMQPFIANRSNLSFSDVPRRFQFPEQDSDPETSTFAGSVLTQGGNEDERVRGGNAFYNTDALNQLLLRDDPEQHQTAVTVTSMMMESPALAPLPQGLEGLGPNDLDPELEHGTFSGMMASIISNNSPQLAVQFPTAVTSEGLQKLDLPKSGLSSVLGNESEVFDPSIEPS